MPIALRHLRRASGAAVLALSFAACSASTGPDRTLDLAQHRARWAAHHLASYQYDYEVTGYFIAYAGKEIRIVVRDGAVQSATYVATGEALPTPATYFPTIDKLFDQASTAEASGSLRGAKFDPALDYPTELDFAGPPDASWSVFASNLRPLP